MLFACVCLFRRFWGQRCKETYMSLVCLYLQTLDWYTYACDPCICCQNALSCKYVPYLFKSYDLSRTIVLNMFSYLIKYIHYVPKLIPPNISKPFFPECLSSTYLPNTSTTNTPIPFPEGK